MPRQDLVVRLPATLARKLVQLTKVAPEAVEGIELLVDAALKRHEEADRAKRLSLLHRVK